MNTTEPIPDVARWEAVEAQVWRTTMALVPAELAERLRLDVTQDGDVLAIHTHAVPSPFFNRLLGVGVHGPADLAMLDRHLERFAAAGVPCGVPVAPGAAAAELVTSLEARGFQRTTSLARMVRGVDALPPLVPDVRIRAVGVEDRALWGQTIARGMGMSAELGELMASICGQDGWRTYLAYADGQPVGTGAIHLHGKVAWIGCGSTLPEYRRRGIQGAMFARRMADAANLGCRWFQTETNLPVADEPTPSLHNMKRLGFQMAYARPNYVRMPS